ncbi:MAG: DUF364 domain-containing protein [Tissierellia bacterium]|nr:DUF364 domain-containing protein [Tissierellia bacterium]
MILERVYQLAKPQLMGRTIKDVRIGLSLLTVEMDNGLLGVTYVLRNEIEHVCAMLPHVENLIGMKAEEIALWAVEGKNVIQNALGLAVLNAVANYEGLKQIESFQTTDAFFSVDIKPEDTVGVIGHIGPIIKQLENNKNRIFVFERDLSNGTETTYPESAQPDLLPKCQIVFVTSSSLINRTLEPLLSYCSNARDIIMVGSSTPLYPEAFIGTGVSVLAGTQWLSTYKQPILETVSQCGGIQKLMKYGQKISIKVSDQMVFEGQR